MSANVHYLGDCFDGGTIPEIGKTYFFYDDGKVRESRQYKVRVTRVVPFDAAKEIPYPFDRFDKEDPFIVLLEEYQNCKDFPSPSWEYIYNKAKEDYDWIYDETTDYIVECEYVGENPSWYTEKPFPMLLARSHGGWYTIDPFYNGRLDADGTLTKELNGEG